VYEFKLPDLGEGIHEGEILKWYVKTGDTIKEDDPLVDVETDKAAVTIPSPKGGKIVSLAGEVGDMVTVGDVVVVIDESGEAAEAPSGDEKAPPAEKPPVEESKAEEEEAPEPKAPAKEAIKGKLEEPSRPEAPSEKPAKAAPEPKPEKAPAEPPKARATGPVPAAPATRRLARELGVDIKLVTPTGPGGRVTVEDVQGFAAGDKAAGEKAPPEAVPSEVADERRAEAEYAAHAASAIPFLDIEPLPDFAEFGPVEKEPLRSIRRKVAHKMVTSMVLVPHVAHMDEADVTELEDFRKRERERREGQPGGRLTLLAFVTKAAAAGLRAAPPFNASLDPFNEEIVYKKYYNIGIAVDTGRGLVVPVVKDADCKSILQISKDVEELSALARDGKLEVAHMRGGTFTITNVGPLGGTALLPTINYPEVAILGMGKVQEKPVVREGEIVIRKILPLTLAFDHRIADGADAARFVSEMVRHLSDPNLLLLET
jgi:pyruvate dehydrogenase E2 component (dihydrolipoamide acetyltransferase)